MGLFDDVKCDYPLPWPEAQGGWFQSTTTPEQYLQRYHLTAAGQLCAKIKGQWVAEKITGEVEIGAWRTFGGKVYDYSAQFWFRDGEIKDAVFTKTECKTASTPQTWDESKLQLE